MPAHNDTAHNDTYHHNHQHDSHHHEGRHHYRIVAEAITYLTDHAAEQPSLERLAAHLGLSDTYLQKVFSEWVGISPKRFLQVLSKETALAALRDTQSTMEAAALAGLSGTGRLYDLMLTCEAMTPGEIQSGGLGMTIEYGVTLTPFGSALLAWTPKGLCFLQFVEDAFVEGSVVESSLVKDSFAEKSEQGVFARLKQDWPKAHFAENTEQATHYSETIFTPQLRRGSLHLVLKGTNFQVKVWQAMMNTSPQRLYSYGQIANLIGQPNASRAVGTALAQNSIGYLIPCHRVIQSSGNVGQFRWNPIRKSAIQIWEREQAHPPKVD